jgi:hypothetical protein
VLRNLLGRDEIRLVEKHFEKTAVTFFDCATLFGAFLGWSARLARHYHRWSGRLDDVLLNQLNLHQLAFKFVIDASRVAALPENPRAIGIGSPE